MRTWHPRELVVVVLAGAAMLVSGADGARMPSRSAASCAVTAAGKKGVALSFEFLGNIMLASDNGKRVSTLLHSRGSRLRGYRYGEPAWSADGRCLAVTRSWLDGVGNFHYLVEVRRGKEPVAVGYGNGPSWEPNGSRVVYHQSDRDGLVIDPVGSGSGGHVELTDGFDSSPAWSPDGATIAFVRYDRTTKRTRIYLIGPDGSGLRQLTTTFGENPTWSPDSSRIAFDDEKRIAVINADGTGLKYLTNSRGRGWYDSRGWFDREPAWSPGGRAIAFVRSHSHYAGEDDLAGNIWIMNPAGGGLHRYLRKNGGDFPAWKPG